ncbi:MAG: GNAT family N-acetyltransferase [Methylobacteriaceae bacterium]|nr:GNAT family N-acetyltransferase [Methylobacteriaceae bacterium]
MADRVGQPAVEADPAPDSAAHSWSVRWGLRRAGAGDVGAITVMQQGAYAPNREIIGREPLPLRVDYTDIISEKDIWVAEKDGAVEALLVLEVRPDELHVWNVSVAPRAQGAGLGNRLLEAAHDRARALGIARLSLLTNERLTRNIAWYKRHGFIVERIEPFEGRAVVHMQKHL